MGEKELVVRLGDRIDLGGRGGLRSLPALERRPYCVTEGATVTRRNDG
jgi:hypothetical protein